MIDYNDSELDAMAEAMQDMADSDPVRQKVTYVHFVSTSKGRGRRRKRKVEIALVGYNGRFTTWDTFEFDKYASEIYGYQSEGEEARLKQDIPKKAKRR